MIAGLAFAAILAWGWATRTLILAVPAVAVTWTAWVYVNPFTDCSWCKGKGRHPLSGKKFFGKCWNPRCQRGTVERLGAKTVHCAVKALVAYRKKGK